MKAVKTVLIVSLLLTSIIVGLIPPIKADISDIFGYTCKDSNTIDGPKYSWIEIKDTGTPLSFDSWYNEVPLEFSFNYYGTYYDNVKIFTYGLLSFSQIIGNLTLFFVLQEHIGNSQTLHNFIAPYLDTLGFIYDYSTNSIISSVTYQTLGEAPNRLFVIEWSNLSISGWGGEGITFEVILNETSNDIIFQYKDTVLSDLTSPPELNNGGSAIVGIEDPSGIMGLEYSYNQPVITDELAILFSYPNPGSDPDLIVSINAPVSIDCGHVMTYTLSYANLGSNSASDVSLQVNLSSSLYSLSFLYASDFGYYDSETDVVTWNIGLVEGYPSGQGSKTVTVEIPAELPIDMSIQTYTEITTTNTESNYEQNIAFATTMVTEINLPPTVDVQSSSGINLDPIGIPIIINQASTAFNYYDLLATNVDLTIHLTDGGPDIVATMVGPPPIWTYTLTFGSRSGEATATFTAHYPDSADVQVVANIEVIRVDPAGYIYDVTTGERIVGATVWLQMPNGLGGWINVPVGEDPETAIADPNVNPLLTGADGRYQWDTIEGTYRVHVEAPGYYPTNSIVVTVPPPVTDLHVGLTKIPLPQDNSVPIIESIETQLYPNQVNSPVVFSASFTDSDFLDTHYAIWTWSDGYLSKGIVTEANGEGIVTGGRIYSAAGVYTETITITVLDNNGGSSEFSVQQCIVIYDPDGGFVTGGGQINSPAGAYAENPALTGKANFGFVSKYQKGATIPTGQTEFQFKVANLNFNSASYDWLVVAGMKAQFKGTGTINGLGEYKFMLIAEDTGSSGQDTFRIKIWDTTTDLVIYDNGAQSPIDGGNIIVHK